MMQRYSLLSNINSIQDLSPGHYPSPLRLGAPDPMLSSILDGMPGITHSPSGSSDPLEDLSVQEWTLQGAYELSADPAADGGVTYFQTDNGWLDYVKNLEIIVPGISTKASLVRATAEEKGLNNYSKSLVQSKHLRSRRLSSSRFIDPNALGDTDDDTGSEYVPPSVLRKRKRIRSPSPTTTCTSASSEQESSSSRKRSVKRMRKEPDVRNLMARPEEWESIRAAVQGDIPKTGRCSYCKKAISIRPPDVRRHMKTHLPREVKCIGVPLCDASRFYIPEDAETYLYNGEPYIGGCMKLFSRPDALKRHLDNCSLGCVSSREITSDSEHH